MNGEFAGLPQHIIDALLDSERLNAVRSTAMANNAPVAEFDRISAMAATVMAAPVAQVTLLETEWQWIKSSMGFDLTQSGTETSFCAYALENAGDLTIVPDAAKDPRFESNPFVENPPHVRFYAGAPILIGKQVVGTVCVYDFEPRETVSQEQQQQLSRLAGDAAGFIKEKRLPRPHDDP